MNQIKLEMVSEISGMFIVPDLVAPASDQAGVWGEQEWKECFARLSEVGIQTAILQYTAQYWSDTRQSFFYQSRKDGGMQPEYQKEQVSYALNAAREYGMDIYLGLQVAEDLWFSDMTNGFTGDFLSKSAEFSNMVAGELWNQFGAEYAQQIAGWYLPFELNNKQVSGESLSRFITTYLRPVTERLNSICDKPIMMSPLVYHDDYLAPANPKYLMIWKEMCRRMWTETSLDIIAPQDGCGWESTTKENLPEWYYALYQVSQEEALVCAREEKGYGTAQVWDNAESYNMNGIDQMPVNRLISDMNAVAPYVSRFVSFSIHYFVPLASDQACGVSPDNRIYYEAYREYYKSHKVISDNSALSAPANLSASMADTFDVQISFDPAVSSSKWPVAGYIIKRWNSEEPESNAVKIAEISQTDKERVVYLDYQLESGASYTYEVYSFDAFGNRCQVPAALEYHVPEVGYYGARETGSANEDVANLVKGQPIIFSSGSFQNSFGFTKTDSGWQTYSATVDDKHPGIRYDADETQTQMAGLMGTGSCYQMTVELTAVSPVHMIKSRWRQDENLGIYLPERVVYYGVDAKTDRQKKLGAVHCSGKPQLDWMMAPNENNVRAFREKEFQTLVTLKGQEFTQIIIEVYPKYPNGWTFFDNVAVYFTKNANF